MTQARRDALAFLDAAIDCGVLLYRAPWDSRAMNMYRAQAKRHLATPKMRRLPTPTQRDWRSGKSNLIGTNARPLNEVAVHQFPDGLGWLHPTFVEWMMGFPKDWTNV